nr:MAG TPA: hypothetical protein [Caudoviricetes sp.]
MLTKTIGCCVHYNTQSCKKQQLSLLIMNHCKQITK